MYNRLIYLSHKRAVTKEDKKHIALLLDQYYYGGKYANKIETINLLDRYKNIQ